MQDRTKTEIDMPDRRWHPRCRQVVKVAGAATLAVVILGGRGFSADAACSHMAWQGAPVASIEEEPNKESAQSLREIRENFRDPSEVLSERAGQTRLEINRDALIKKGNIKSEGPEQGTIIGGLLKELEKNGYVVDGVWTEQALLDGEISAEHVRKKPHWMHMNVFRKGTPLPDTSVRKATDADVAEAYRVIPNFKRMHV